MARRIAETILTTQAPPILITCSTTQSSVLSKQFTKSPWGVLFDSKSARGIHRLRDKVARVARQPKCSQLIASIIIISWIAARIIHLSNQNSRFLRKGVLGSFLIGFVDRSWLLQFLRGFLETTCLQFCDVNLRGWSAGVSALTQTDMSKVFRRLSGVWAGHGQIWVSPCSLNSSSLCTQIIK